MRKILLLVICLIILPRMAYSQFGGGGGPFASQGGTSIVFDTVANLPGSPSTNDLAGVTDGADESDCTVGTGTDQNICIWSGSAWLIIGDGTAAASSGDSVTVNSVGVDTTANFLDAAPVTFSLADGGAGGPDDITIIVGDAVADASTKGISTYTARDFSDSSGVISSRKGDFYNGTFAESFDADVTSNGTTVTMSIEQTGTGNLTSQFSSGNTAYTTAPDTIALTAGSDASPQGNWIYILESAPTTLVKSTSTWPSAEHIKVGFFFVQTATSVQTDSGPFINQNWNEHLQDTNNIGHLSHIGRKLRQIGPTYFSGVDGNGATASYYTISASNTEFISTSGTIDQLHMQTFPALNTSTGSVAHVVNSSVSSYRRITDLFSITTDSTGTTIGNNKYFNLTLWGVINKTGERQMLMVNVPGGFYNSQSGAENDVSGFDVFTIPREFGLDSSNGFLIARTTFQMGTTWTHVSTVDLRGTKPQTASGGAGGVATDFADNTFTVFDNTDNTKVLAFDVGTNLTTGNTRTLSVPDASGTIALTSDKLSAFSATTSAELAGVISDETGTGVAVFGTSPTFTTDIDTPEIANTAGNLKIQPDVQGDVVLFGDTDVGDADMGKRLYFYRRAAEGDASFNVGFNSFGQLQFQGNVLGGMSFFNQNGQDILFGAYRDGNILFSVNTPANPYIRQHGYITADTDDNYIQWQISDTTDNFELTREDSNIGNFDIQMPLITDAITASATIEGATLTEGGNDVYNSTDYPAILAENGAEELLGETLGTACAENEILKTNATGGLDCAADSTGGTPSFDSIATGTNTTATMTVSTGASIAVSGTGTVTATSGDSATSFFSSGEIADAQVVDTLTASNYLPLAGGTMTGSLITDNLGIEYVDSDTNPTCGAGEYKIYADTSETTLKKCINGSATDLDTGGAETNSLETLTTGIALNEVPTGTAANTVVYKLMPDCNVAGSALNYEDSTQTWSCRSGFSSGGTHPIAAGDYAADSIDDDDILNSADVMSGSFGITIDGGGSVVSIGIKGYIEIPYAMTIDSVTMLADQSGSAVVDIWVNSFASYPPTDANSITASAVPTISTAIKSQDTTLTGWTTSVTAGDIVGFNIDSASTITRLHIIVSGNKN